MADKKPKKTYTLNNFAKKELRKQELGIKEKPIAEKVGEGLGDNTALLNQGLQNVSFSNRPVNTTTFEPPATQQNVTQQPEQQTETTGQQQNYLLNYGNSGLPNSEISTLLGSVLTGQTQQNLYDNVSHSLNKIKEGAELFDPNVGLTPGNAFAGIKFMNGLAGLSFLPITAVNEVLKQNPVTDWLNKGAMLPFELADELYTLTQKGTDYAFEKITGNKPDRNNPLSQELDEFVRTANQLLIGGKAFHETGKFFKKGMPEVKEVKQMSYEEYKKYYDKEPELININLPEFKQFRENNPTLLLPEKAGADFYATPDGQIITLTDYEKPAKNVTNGMTQEEIKLSQKNISGKKLTAQEQSKINSQVTSNTETTENTTTEKKPYEQPATIIGEQPKQTPEIDLGNKRQTFTKIINEFDKDLQSIEQRLASGEITKQEFDELEKQYNETENKKKTWQKRLDEITEEPKPIGQVTENKRANEDDIYSLENIKNPKYPDRTNEVTEQPKTKKTVSEPNQVETPSISLPKAEFENAKEIADKLEPEIEKLEAEKPSAENASGKYFNVEYNGRTATASETDSGTVFYVKTDSKGNHTLEFNTNNLPYGIPDLKDLITLFVNPDLKRGEIPVISKNPIMEKKGDVWVVKTKGELSNTSASKLKSGKDPGKVVAKLEADLKVENSAKLPEPKQDAVEKVEGESNESKKEISRWEDIIQKQEGKGIERLKSYMASKTLGRDFGETVSAMFERKGLTDFNKWATDKIKNYDKAKPESKLTPEKPVEPPTLEQKKETRRQNLAEKKNKPDANKVKDAEQKEITPPFSEEVIKDIETNAKLQKKINELNKELNGMEYGERIEDKKAIRKKIENLRKRKKDISEGVNEKYLDYLVEKRQAELKAKGLLTDKKTIPLKEQKEKALKQLDEIEKIIDDNIGGLDKKDIISKEIWEQAGVIEQLKKKGFDVTEGVTNPDMSNESTTYTVSIDLGNGMKNKIPLTHITEFKRNVGKYLTEKDLKIRPNKNSPHPLDMRPTGARDFVTSRGLLEAETKQDVINELADMKESLATAEKSNNAGLIEKYKAEVFRLEDDLKGIEKKGFEEAKRIRIENSKNREYLQAKQTIKDALSKDSGISFGGLSKLGDLADPKVLKAVYDVAKYHYENGAKNIREFANKVIEDLGNWVEPHLKELWKKAKEEPLANKNAKKYFGTTNYIKEAGYITPKGELLDLSGKNQGGEPFTRALDHREISQASEGLTDMREFIDLGNVRFLPESSTFDILKPLTRKQEKVMTAIIRYYKGDVAIEVQNGKGEYRPEYQMHVNSGRELGKVYPKGTSPKVVFDDIRKFFEEEGTFKKRETEYQTALKSLQEKINRANMTFGLDTLPEVYTIAKYHTGKFAEWSKKVIKDVGNWIKPHLRNLYQEITKDRTGIDNVVTQGFPLSFKKKTEIIKNNLENPQTEVRDISEILPTTKNKRAILASDIFTKGDKEAGKDVFNYDNFTESTQINELIRETATENKKAVDEQKRDVRTWAKTQEGADMLRAMGLDENAFFKMSKGDSLLAERIMAGKDIVNIAGQELLERIKNLPKGNDPKTALANDYLKYVALVKNLKGLVSESGRALNIARKKSNADVQVKLDLADELIKAGFDTTSLPDFASKTLKIIEPTYKDKFYYWWYNSMLSNPLTDVANITGNLSHFGFELMRNALSQNPKDSMQMLRDMKEAHTKGMKQVKDIIKNGETADSKFDYNERRYGEAFQPISKAGKRFKAILPTTRLAFEDAYFRNMFGAIRKNATLKEISKETGDPVAKVENLIKAIAHNPDLASLDKKFEIYQKHLNALERFIDYGVFQTPLGEAGRNLQSGINKLPPAKMIFPFMKIAVNIAKTGIRTTPYGLKDFLTRKDLTRLEKKDIISRAVTGSAFLAGLGYLISQGAIEITGHGIDDKDKRELWHKQGYKENHFYMNINGEKYGFSYQNINPINIPFSIIGNLQDDAKYNAKKKDLDDTGTEKIIKSLLGMAETLSDQSFMQGISNLMRYIQDKDIEGLYKNAQNLFTPNILSLPRDIKNMAGDGKTQYETNDPESRFKDKIGLTEGLKPKLNQFGEPIKSTYERFPFMVSKSKPDDKLTEFLAENNIEISFPSKTTKIGDQVLSDSPSAYYEYTKLSGERFKQELLKQLPELEKLKTKEEKDDAVDKIVKDIRQQVKQEMAGEDPKEKKTKKKHLTIPGRPNPGKESERNSENKQTFKKHLIIPK